MTRTVLNCGKVVGFVSTGSAEEADGGGGAAGAVLSCTAEGELNGRGFSSTFVAQWSCDFDGMAPVFLNQHLRPSISR